MVRAGEVHTHESGVKVRIVEVMEYREFRGRRMLMIAYQIIDGDYTSPVAHFWMPKMEDIRPHIEKVVGTYLSIRGAVRR